MEPCDICAAEKKDANQCQLQLTWDVELLNNSKVHIVASKNLTRETIHCLAGICRALMLKKYNEQRPPT